MDDDDPDSFLQGDRHRGQEDERGDTTPDPDSSYSLRLVDRTRYSPRKLPRERKAAKVSAKVQGWSARTGRVLLRHREVRPQGQPRPPGHREGGQVQELQGRQEALRLAGPRPQCRGILRTAAQQQQLPRVELCSSEAFRPNLSPQKSLGLRHLPCQGRRDGHTPDVKDQEVRGRPPRTKGADKSSKAMTLLDSSLFSYSC